MKLSGAVSRQTSQSMHVESSRPYAVEAARRRAEEVFQRQQNILQPRPALGEFHASAEAASIDCPLCVLYVIEGRNVLAVLHEVEAAAD
jgi:hypothetical protein